MGRAAVRERTGGPELLSSLVAAQDYRPAGQAGRIAVARRVVAELRAAEPIVAALAVGSTAIGRCSANSDLDIVVIAPDVDPTTAFSTAHLEGLRVEIERIGLAEAHAKTAGDGWVPHLRAAARLGGGIALFDPDGIAGDLRRRADTMRPDSAMAEDCLRGIYVGLIELSESEASAAALREGFRGCLDNLVLLTLLHTPRRYRKAKWVLADLLHADEADLALALLTAYGVTRSCEGDTTACTSARVLVERVHGLTGAPDHDALIAMGYAPQYAEASYVSRCLADAEDLARDGAWVEAQYTAKFAARLAAGRLATPDRPDQGVLGTLGASGGGELRDLYLDVFSASAPTPSTADLRLALRAADACKAALQRGAAPQALPA